MWKLRATEFYKTLSSKRWFKAQNYIVQNDDFHSSDGLSLNLEECESVCWVFSQMTKETRSSS